MRSLSDTISRLAALRGLGQRGVTTGAAGDLAELADFGSNPGALSGYFHLPDGLQRGAPLVVVLHGCTQNAAGYNHGSGWSQLADQYGFALLFPEQRRANNMNLCFNWYEPGDSRRDAGEPQSIAQMIAAMIDRYDLDSGRVYVNGLSAGGAMTSVMLATYPELFAGGAIIAGLPFGTASNVPQAFDRMRGHGSPSDAALAASVRVASRHNGPWPTVSVWHGSSDRTVDASNGDAILAQWRGVHGLPAAPDLEDQVDGYPHRAWHDSDGRAVIEEYRITGMGHGTPLDSLNEDGYGASGAHMLEVAISSTRHIARFWGLLDTGAQAASKRAVAPKADRPVRIDRPANPRPAGSPAPANGVGKVIEDALRAAGLMR